MEDEEVVAAAEEDEEEAAAEEEESISIKNNQRDKTGSIAKGLGVAIQIIVFFKQNHLRPGFSDNVSLIRPFV